MSVLEDAELEALKKFLFEHVVDLEELQILARFHRQAGKDSFTEEEMAAATGLPIGTTRDTLQGLSARGLLAPSVTAPAVYRYVVDGEVRELLDRVLSEYEANPLQVLGLMTANSIERVRTSAMRAFADSFRIRRPKSNG
jgi:hypothetical protein